MERQFKIGNVNTYSDWGLILTSKSIHPPEPKTNRIEVDGMDGSIDLSETLSGRINYADRVISASFWTDAGTRDDRSELIRNIITSIHGKKLQIIEPDDLQHYFSGRCRIASYENILAYATISMEFTCSPYRYGIAERSVEAQINTAGMDSYTTRTFINYGSFSVTPELVVVGDVGVSVNGKIVRLNSGTHKVTGLVLLPGTNNVKFSNRGTITVKWREVDI